MYNMSYLQYNPYSLSRQGLKAYGPYPYVYPFANPCPNLCAEANTIVDPNANYFAYDFSKIYDIENGLCHNPTHDMTNNLSVACRDPCIEKYDYACYEETKFQDPCTCLQFFSQNLVSNFAGLALNFDPNLLNAWGIAIINDTIWVANTSSGLITSYDIAGAPLAQLVNVFGPAENIGSPTGIVYNGCNNGFRVVKSVFSGPSTLLIATLDGTINGYNPAVCTNNSFIVVNNSTENCVYTGLTLLNDKLYVADFFNAKIDVFDHNFNRLNGFSFIDQYSTDPIPGDYAPYNIAKIGEFLFVAYAKQNPLDNQFTVPGIGHGYISIFNFKGIFVKRFVSRGMLNSPWGMVLVPTWFGYPAGSIFVANTGNGTIGIYDATGCCLGKLKNENLHDIFIEGVKGLVNSPNYSKIVYWTGNNITLVNSFVGSIGFNVCC